MSLSDWLKFKVKGVLARDVKTREFYNQVATEIMYMVKAKHARRDGGIAKIAEQIKRESVGETKKEKTGRKGKNRKISVCEVELDI